MSTKAPAPAPSRAEVQRWYTEFQQIRARLQQAHDRAMEDPQLLTANESFMQDVQAAMDRADPALRLLARRVRQLDSLALGAEQRRDGGLLQVLRSEYLRIQERFLQVQARILREPSFAQRAQALERALLRKMSEFDPEVDDLLERSQELETLLARAGIRVPATPRQ
jgi:hypothetical protein